MGILSGLFYSTYEKLCMYRVIYFTELARYASMHVGNNCNLLLHINKPPQHTYYSLNERKFIVLWYILMK